MRTETLIFRVSEDEKKLIEEQSKICGLTVSEYMRRRIFGHRVFAKIPKTDEQMIGELRKVGGLVKQLFKYKVVNQDYTAGIMAKLQEVIKYIRG